MTNHIGNHVTISEKARVANSVLKDYTRLKDYSELINSELGDYSYLSQFSVVNKTIVGKFCSIAHGSYIGLWEHNREVTTHSFYLFESSGNFVNGYIDYELDKVLTYIGNDVWVGANSVILKGVRVGNGAIVGASAVVTKDIPPYAIAVGNPARIIKYRFDDDTIKFLQELEWWNLPREMIQEMVDKNVFFSMQHLKDFVSEKPLFQRKK